MKKADYNSDEEIQAKKYKFISKQHGGYYRYKFVDHAYLYNLYFPPVEIFSNFKNNIRNIVSSYPVGQDALAYFISKLINQSSEKIVVGNGAAEIIKIICGQIAKKIIIPVPSFNEYVNAAPKDNVIEFPLEFPSFSLDVNKFASEAIRIGADVAIVVTPNNPTSILIPKSDLIYLAKRLKNHNCTLIIDESFIDFSENPNENSLEKEIDLYPNIAILKSMSKAYGICGLRIGHMLTANLKFAQAVRKGIHIWNINGFAEEFLRIIPNYKKQFIESCKLVRIDRNKLYEKLCNLPKMVVYKPDANFIFCRLPDYSPSGPKVTRELFIKHNIYIKHCQEKTLPDSDRYIRIASRTEVENDLLVNALASIINTNDEEFKRC